MIERPIPLFTLFGCSLLMFQSGSGPVSRRRVRQALFFAATFPSDTRRQLAPEAM